MRRSRLWVVSNAERSVAYVQFGGTLLKRGRIGRSFPGTNGEADAHLLGLYGGEVNANHIGSGKVICHVNCPSRRKTW